MPDSFYVHKPLNQIADTCNLHSIVQSNSGQDVLEEQYDTSKEEEEKKGN